MHRFRYDGTRPARSYTPESASSRIVSIGKSGGEGAGPRPAHRRRACDRHDPAPVSRDVRDPRPPRDGAGYFLAHLIESGGDWNQTVAAIFGGAFALPLWRSIPLIILSVGFDVYLLWLVRHSRLHIARYAKEIAPLPADREAGGPSTFFPPSLPPPPVWVAPPPLSSSPPCPPPLPSS